MTSLFLGVRPEEYDKQIGLHTSEEVWEGSLFSDFNSWKGENVSKILKSDSYMLSKSFGGDLLRSGLTRRR